MAQWDSGRWDASYWSAVVGTMAATETTTDTFASTGTVEVKGSMAAVETTTDTFSASGTVTVNGYMAAVETTTDTFSAEGVVTVNGYMEAVETTSDVFSAEGTVAVTGSMNAVETTSDTFEAYGLVQVVGYMAAVETEPDTFAATGEVTPQVVGYMAATETTDDTFSATGTVTPKPAPVVIADVGDEKQRKKAQKKRDEAFAKYKREQEKLREAIEIAIDPAKAKAEPVVVSQGKKTVEVLSTDGSTITIDVPPLFTAEEVARSVSEALFRANVEAMQVERQKAEQALAIARANLARIIKRRQDDEILLLMD